MDFFQASREHGHISSFLEYCGCFNLKPLADKGRHLIYEGIQENREVIVKVSPVRSREKNDASGIEVQQCVQCLLKTLESAGGIAIPESKLYCKDGMCALVMEKITGEVCADSHPDAMQKDFSYHEIQALTDFLARVRRISFDQLDPYLQWVSTDVWNADFYKERLGKNAQFPCEAGLLSQENFQEIVMLFDQQLLFSFQHHDFAPFNMIRQPSGSLAVLDGEFGRWGMRGYDEAYFVLQTTCLLAKPKSALEFLQSAKASWTAEGEDLYKSMKTAFAYRLVAQMNDEGCKASSQVRERTEKVAWAFFAEGMEGVERVLASL